MDERYVSSAFCPVCGFEVPSGARFCAHCGRPVATSAVETAAFEAAPFGNAPGAAVQAVTLTALPAFAALVLLVLAGAGLGTGHWVIGCVLLALAALLGAALPLAPTRALRAGVGRRALAAGSGARARGGLARVVVTSWSHAGREAVELKARRHRLQRERDALVRNLGEAALAGDADASATLRREGLERVAAIEECERRLERALELARHRVGRERLQIRSTRILATDAGSGQLEDEPASDG
jgi:hypothetical protein